MTTLLKTIIHSIFFRKERTLAKIELPIIKL
jgi:hypothetical protein